MFLNGSEKELPTLMRSIWRWKLKAGSDCAANADGQKSADPISRPLLRVKLFNRRTAAQSATTGPATNQLAKLATGPATGPAAVLARHLAGDPNAFGELVSQYGSRVYGYLSRCGVNDAQRDDLFQEVFLRIHRGADKFRFDCPLEPWLFAIVANVVRSHFRKEPQPTDLESEAGEFEKIAAAVPSAIDLAELKETAQFIETAISELSLPQREVLLLAVYEKMELQEIANLLGMPVNTVKTHLRRARLALAEKLAKLALKAKREAGI